MKKVIGVLAVGMLVLMQPLSGHAPSGAIFTTVVDGTEVNFNHYAAKEDVYLDGGPGPGAPQHAAGLDDGTYVFQVTDPSGKSLLSTDAAKCRQFTVAAGIISGVVVTGCEHSTGLDVDHGAATVQLIPYDDTPNPGGVYKAWATRVEDYLLGCSQVGVANGLDVVDCGNSKGGGPGAVRHGFIPSHSKTDNFKVKETKVREIDTRFFNDRDGDGHRSDGEEGLDGLQISWNDPIGGSNRKSSYWAPNLNIFHEAHVEAVEDGTHQITIQNQPGCQVGAIHVDGEDTAVVGPQTVDVTVSRRDKEITIFIDVACTVQ